MLKNKLIHILSLFLVLFMVVCAVSAASNHIAVGDANDGNNTLKVSKDIGNKESTLNTNLENKTVENKVGTVSNYSRSNDIDTSFTQLEDDIFNCRVHSTSHAVLNLTHDYIYNPNRDRFYSYGIDITQDLIINGNNHTISGANIARLFFIYSGTITINNLIITNCSDSCGSCWRYL